MIAVVTLLLAFPLGYFVSSRLAASTAYAIAYLWAFVFQTLYLTLDSLGGGRTRRSRPVTSRGSTAWSALAIFGVGFGLVNLGHGRLQGALVADRHQRERRPAGTRAVSANVAP